MSDFTRLEDKLSKLRQRERAPGEGRKLRGNDPDALLSAIVTEIDETILPRHLTFAADDDGPVIHLVAANRKLQAMLSPVPKGIDKALADQELPDADDPKVPALALALRGVLKTDSVIRISSKRPENLYPSDVGVPTSQLKRVWGVEDGDSQAAAEPAEILGDFLASLGDDAIAWLRIDGEAVSDQSGDTDAAEKLGATAAVFLDSYFSKFDTLYPTASMSCATVVMPPADQTAALLFIEFGDHSAVISAKPDKVLALATRWQGRISE